MSKVFSPKRQIIEVEYQFSNGEKVDLVLQSLSSKQQKELMNKFEDHDNLEAIKFGIELMFIKNKKETIKNLINDMYENDDIAVFWEDLNSLIKDSKEKK